MTWALDDLLPHRAPMVLIDGVESFDPVARSITARVSITPDHVLYSTVLGGVPNWAAIEFMAQAAAALAGCIDKERDPSQPARPGLLLGTRRLDLRTDSFAAGRTYSVTLRVDSTRAELLDATRGIGKAIAERLRSDGFDVVTHAVRSPDADLHFDVANRDEARRVLEADIAANGPYYGVVLNAGVAADAPFPAMEDDAWDRVLRTDLDGFYNVLKPLVMPMVSARIRGRIVALSSVSGLAGNRGQVNYSAAKAGVIGAVKALAVELAKRGITVNAVAPGVIDTEMAASLEFPDEVKKAIPMRRFGTPEEVAAVVAFLFREDAAYVTRQVISVNGGLSECDVTKCHAIA